MPRGVYDRAKQAARGASPAAAPGRAEVSDPACRECLWFKATAADIGECRRYPRYEMRRGIEWCGEFVAEGARS